MILFFKFNNKNQTQSSNKESKYKNQTQNHKHNNQTKNSKITTYENKTFYYKKMKFVLLVILVILVIGVFANLYYKKQQPGGFLIDNKQIIPIEDYKFNKEIEDYKFNFNNFNKEINVINNNFDKLETKPNVVKKYNDLHKHGINRGILFNDGKAKFATYNDEHTKAYKMYEDKKFDNGFSSSFVYSEISNN